MFLADDQTHLFMQLYELFWDPSCIDFMEPNSVVNDFVGRTVNNSQTICYLINSYSLNIFLICGGK